MDYSGKVWLNGTDLSTNASADKTIIAAQGVGKTFRVMSGVVSVTVAAVGGGGLVALENGVDGTVIWQANADASGVYQIDFRPVGYPLTENTLLNLTVNGAATTQASARATIVAIL